MSELSEVKSNRDYGIFLTKGNDYRVLRETNNGFVIIDDTNQELGFPKDYFIIPNKRISRIKEFFGDLKNPTIEDTKRLTQYLFKDMVDKSGNAYYFHLKTVADLYKATFSGDTDDYIVALLHDVLEDIRDVSGADLLEYYSDKIVNRIYILTKKDGQPYEEYIEGVAEDEVTLRIKTCDLEHNMDITRLPIITSRDINNILKYHAAYKYLTERL